jgi:sugar phosphate isomerase/epimerase
MIQYKEWPIGVCSWCLSNDLDKLTILREETKLSNLNLGVWTAVENNDYDFVKRVLREKWDVDATVTMFPQEDYSTLDSIRMTGGIVPDNNWSENRARIKGAIDMTERLGATRLLFHFGFFDNKDKKAAQKFKDRTRELADLADKKKIVLLMETGQESAEDLCELLTSLDHPALMVNLDPGNMILYDKNDPMDAMKILSPWIKQIHVKDAVRSRIPNQWGKEVPWGEGQVGGKKFLLALHEIGFKGSLIIEREVGDNPVKDIKLAIKRICAS